MAEYSSRVIVYVQMHAWQNAVEADGMFISKYGEDRPQSEDIAESLVPWMSVRCAKYRQNPDKVKTILRRIPNRLQYFDRNIKLIC